MLPGFVSSGRFFVGGDFSPVFAETNRDRESLRCPVCQLLLASQGNDSVWPHHHPTPLLGGDPASPQPIVGWGAWVPPRCPLIIPSCPEKRRPFIPAERCPLPAELPPPAWCFRWKIDANWKGREKKKRKNRNISLIYPEETFLATLNKSTAEKECEIILY